jgi:predicted P-loop ATPase
MANHSTIDANGVNIPEFTDAEALAYAQSWATRRAASKPEAPPASSMPAPPAAVPTPEPPRTVAMQTQLASDARGYLATIPNILLALRSSDVFNHRVRLDKFLDAVQIFEGGAWRRFTDNDYTALREALQVRGFKEISADKMRDAVLKVAEENQFDSATTWLKALEWDGKPRVRNFLAYYLGAECSNYSEAVSEYLWTALAGRVLVPGIKADMALVLIGPQGVGKTRAVQALAPWPDAFVEIDLTAKDDDIARRMRGKLVAELPELKGLRSRDADSIKSFISRQREEWTPKYREFVAHYDRRLVFVGTTNDNEFLSDPTGNRRWLPVTIIRDLDVQSLERDREQLWAEGAYIFYGNEMARAGLTDPYGIRWEAAEYRARQVVDAHMLADDWDAPVQQWLAAPPMLTLQGPARGAQPFTSHDVLTGALGFKGAQVTGATGRRLAAILKRLGYEQARCYVSGVRVRAWTKPGTVAPEPADVAEG